jgi:hypothetical protein
VARACLDENQERRLSMKEVIIALYNATAMEDVSSSEFSFEVHTFQTITAKRRQMLPCLLHSTNLHTKLSFLSFAFIQKKQIHFSNYIIIIHLMLEAKPLQDLQCDNTLERISQHKSSKFSSQLYLVVVL